MSPPSADPLATTGAWHLRQTAKAFAQRDALAGNRIAFNKRAVVRWAQRPTPEAYYGLLYRNGYGAAEARLYSRYFLRRLLLTLLPFLLLLSKHRFQHIKHRFRNNASSSLGWLAGGSKAGGHRRVGGGWTAFC